MITAAHRDKGRNQMKCIKKHKPKTQNKIRQYEKNKPIFQYPLSFFLIILLPIHPSPSPFPVMAAEIVPSRHPPYNNNNCNWRYSFTIAAAMIAMPTVARD
jgi:hypothetical protein